jgi:thiol-disulfide isomerase/thioredoxin/uncharacterized membrane protein YphA (DoxX/SURF4 family)
MKAVFQNKWLILFLRLGLGAIFIVASIAKIQDIAKFISTINSYGILSGGLANLYGYVVPWVELFIGCSMILGVFIRFSAIISFLLTISFMIASSYALINDVGGPCGCFGQFLSMSHQVSLTIDVLMIMAAIIVIFYKGKEFSSLEQLIDKISIKSKLGNICCRFISVALIVLAIGLISIYVHNPTSEPYEIIETVSIPSPFANEVNNALAERKPVLLEFYAQDCDACEKAEPIINYMESQYVNRIVFIHADYFQNPLAVSAMNIRATPTILVIVGKNTEGKYEVLCRYESTINSEDLQVCLDNALK